MILRQTDRESCAAASQPCKFFGRSEEMHCSTACISSPCLHDQLPDTFLPDIPLLSNHNFYFSFFFFSTQQAPFLCADREPGAVSVTERSCLQDRKDRGPPCCAPGVLEAE